jgi:preprotein translocase subunit SecG
MYLFVVALHVVLSLLLILIIILQPGKGGDVGAAFGGGGGGGSLFGPRGPASMLAQATTFVAVGFMGTSIVLAYYSNPELLSNANVDDELLRIEEQRLQEEAADEGASMGAVGGGDAAPVEAPASEEGASPDAVEDAPASEEPAAEE